jgi:putative iron-regulated protein
LAARPDNGLTEAFRFYGGPIDNEENGPEGLINAWPLDEAYIDYVDGDPSAGIVNDPATFPQITSELLVSLNTLEGEDSISTGWHAIEFLLWGQDHNPDGPGNRPFTDYVAGAGGTAANQARRATYLRVVADLLVENLRQVKDAWAPGSADNYRAEFLSVDADEALTRILTGMGELSGGELTGERLAVAFDTKDQEDEHSCSRTNTHIFIDRRDRHQNAYLDATAR